MDWFLFDDIGYQITNNFSLTVGVHSTALCYGSTIKRSSVVFVGEWSFRNHDILGMNCLLRLIVITILVLNPVLCNRMDAQLKILQNNSVLMILLMHLSLSPTWNWVRSCADTFSPIFCAFIFFCILFTDPTVPMFKEWLNHLGGGEYAAKFIEAGYDLPFIAKHGVTAEDLDCVGIPSSKMGLRRKISTLHELSQFYEADADEEEEEEEEEGEEEDEEEEG